MERRDGWTEAFRRYVVALVFDGLDEDEALVRDLDAEAVAAAERARRESRLARVCPCCGRSLE